MQRINLPELRSAFLEENPLLVQKVAEIFAKHHKSATQDFSLPPTSVGRKPLSSFRLEGFSTPRYERRVKHSVRRENRVSTSLKTTNPSTLTKRIEPEEIPPHKQAGFNEWLFREWQLVLRSTFGAAPSSSNLEEPYKYFIGQGNNSALVTSILKSRWWWQKCNNPANAHFVWTQSKHTPTMLAIKKAPLPHSQLPQRIEVLRPKLPRAIVAAKMEAVGFYLIKKPGLYRTFKRQRFVPNQLILHNKLAGNKQICSKKGLLKNMVGHFGEKAFDRIPMSFHVSKVDQMQEFLNAYKPGSLWIVKPGEGTNRGRGITVTNRIEEIKSIVSNAQNGRTYVIQKYIEKPLLIHKRKFDIRCYGMVTSLGSQIQGFFYKEGYIRTSSKTYSTKKLRNKFIHLTNDAIQKTADDYGKFELANKLSYPEFQSYLQSLRNAPDFYQQILPQIREMVAESISTVSNLLANDTNTFEIFGYDFMIDRNFKVWLIEVNTNPCLELSNAYLASLIPAMIDNAFRITLDPLFPPPDLHRKYKKWVSETCFTNNFELVFSSVNPN